MVNPAPKPSLTLVGAGLTSAILVHLLNKHFRILVLEKSRGVGGRATTKRIQYKDQPILFNSGLRSWDLLPKDCELLKKVGLQLSKACEIKPNGAASVFKGMNGELKKLFADVELKTQFEVAKIEQTSKGWTISDPKGESLTSDYLIVTAPWPQSKRLTQPFLDTLPALETRELVEKEPLFEAQLTLMMGSEHPEFQSPESWGQLLTKGDHLWEISSIHRHPPLWTAQAFLKIYSEHGWYQKDLIEIEQELRSYFAESKLDLLKVHRWKYAFPKSGFARDFLQPSPGLFIGGDVWAGQNPEAFQPLSAAINSAFAISNYLKGSLR